MSRVIGPIPFGALVTSVEEQSSSVSCLTQNLGIEEEGLQVGRPLQVP